MSKEYNIGIYIRLSMADEDTGYGSKAESDSIGNQRMLINRFLDNHPELSHCQRSEFADDGYTGTNFHRPQCLIVVKGNCIEHDVVMDMTFINVGRHHILVLAACIQMPVSSPAHVPAQA